MHSTYYVCPLFVHHSSSDASAIIDELESNRGSVLTHKKIVACDDVSDVTWRLEQGIAVEGK